jgi:hypothetical protein
VNSLTVTETARSGFVVSLKAVAQMSDGTSMDMTRMAVWSLTDAQGHPRDVSTLFQGRISNEEETSGQLTLRGQSSEPMYVTASYQGNNRPFVSSAALKVTRGPVTAPARNILIFPGRKVVSVPSGGTTLQLGATRVLANGEVFSPVNDQVDWTSSDPAVTIDAFGLATFTTPPATARKNITITATAKGDSQVKGVANIIVTR